MNPLLFISSLPFLDLLDNLIVLAAEFVAIFCLNDYIHSLIGVITGAFYACTLVCLVPMQLKQLMCGSDEDGDGGGMNIAGINLGNV